jgi:hypothetical protein
MPGVGKIGHSSHPVVTGQGRDNTGNIVNFGYTCAPQPPPIAARIPCGSNHCSKEHKKIYDYFTATCGATYRELQSSCPGPQSSRN